MFAFYKLGEYNPKGYRVQCAPAAHCESVCLLGGAETRLSSRALRRYCGLALLTCGLLTLQANLGWSQETPQSSQEAPQSAEPATSVPLQLVPDLQPGTEEDIQSILNYYNQIQEINPTAPSGVGTGQVAIPSEAAEIGEILSRLSAPNSAGGGSAFAPPEVPTGQDGSGGRDPFAITARLQRVSTGGIEGVQFVPQAEPVTSRELPRMQLRGLIKASSTTTARQIRFSGASPESAAEDPRLKAALLEIDGAGVYVVREGDTVGLHRLGKSSVLKIIGVTELSVVVEVGTLGEVIVVR